MPGSAIPALPSLLEQERVAKKKHFDSAMRRCFKPTKVAIESEHLLVCRFGARKDEPKHCKQPGFHEQDRVIKTDNVQDYSWPSALEPKFARYRQVDHGARVDVIEVEV